MRAVILRKQVSDVMERGDLSNGDYDSLLYKLRS